MYGKAMIIKYATMNQSEMKQTSMLRKTLTFKTYVAQKYSHG